MGLMTSRNRHHKISDVSYPATRGYDPVISKIVGLPIGYVGGGNALKNSDIFSVINRIASDIASARFNSENTYVNERLNQPSKLIGRFSFWQGVVIQLLLSGNAYVPLDLDYLEQIPPSSIISIDIDSSNQGAVYTLAEYNNHPERKLTQGEMLHFRLMPDATYQYLVGMSPLESLTKELTVSTASADQSLNLIKNRITPTSVLQISNALLEQGDADAARDAFEKANNGDNNGRLMVLDANSTFNQFEMKADVFKALNNNAEYSANQISKAFGVPVDMLGGGNSTESQHSNSTQIKNLYYENLISYVAPVIDEIVLKMNADDLSLDLQYVDDATRVSQINDMVKVGTLGQAQGEFMLKKYGVLPINLPAYVPPVQEKGESE
ncbi:prophage pi1 protein 35 [Leuconostoc kimchii IMSNU 11154]|uniref:Prophage pi1 protein 35 n=1 Tax=Leuconostoc kimchii (strain IMSNU 11154 / KCTC 2386 / IH25) TaxID=762051 RepID=D5T0V3_LEUKI|nr:phage portal protein [Leuconostoc kimchii]ADG39902.1 prophage pi1 protein 35 [Leuconostoc kimchii IMSNU 11154]